MLSFCEHYKHLAHLDYSATCIHNFSFVRHRNSTQIQIFTRHRNSKQIRMPQIGSQPTWAKRCVSFFSSLCVLAIMLIRAFHFIMTIAILGMQYIWDTISEFIHRHGRFLTTIFPLEQWIYVCYSHVFLVLPWLTNLWYVCPWNYFWNNGLDLLSWNPFV